MFDKELQQKLIESMESPRDLGFDEGAWQSLEQQLDLLGTAAGGSLVGGGLKAAFWAGKSWLSMAAAIVLLGSTAFFFYQWQTAKQEFESLKVLTEQTVKAEAEIGTISPAPDIKAAPKIQETNPQSQLPSKGNFVPASTQPTSGNKKEKKSTEISASSIDLKKLAFLPTTLPLSVGESLPRLEPRRILPSFESRTQLAQPFRIAVEASLVNMRAENLQPFKGQAIGLRGEYWLSQRMALQVGFRQERTEAHFSEEKIHLLRSRLPGPAGPFQLESKLIEATFYKKSLQLPLGIRYALWQSQKIQVLAGLAAIMEKPIEKEAWLTYRIRDNRPPFPPLEFVYSQPLRSNEGPLNLSQLAVEWGARVQLKPLLAWEVTASMQQNLRTSASLYHRPYGQKASTSLVFSF